MSDCGERYYAQYVVDDCGVWCGVGEVGTALAKLRNLQDAIELAWNKIMGIENTLQAWPVTAMFDAEYTAWLARDEFPDEYEGLEGLIYAERETFERIRNVARDGVCLLDRLVVAGQEQYPEAAPNIEPATPFEPAAGLGFWGWLGIGLGVTVLVTTVVAIAWNASNKEAPAQGRRGRA